MKTWYQNKMKQGYNHRGKPVGENQKVWLTVEQAESLKGKVEKCDPPGTILDCAASEDHAFWQESIKKVTSAEVSSAARDDRANNKMDIQNSETKTEKENKSTKANSRNKQ